MIHNETKHIPTLHTMLQSNDDTKHGLVEHYGAPLEIDGTTRYKAIPTQPLHTSLSKVTAAYEPITRHKAIGTRSQQERAEKLWIRAMFVTCVVLLLVLAIAILVGGGVIDVVKLFGGK